MIYILDLFGTFAFAISGALLGVKKDMDIYGLFVLALAVAVGGGTVRELMLSSAPPFVLTDINYLICVVIAVLIVAFFNRGVERGLRFLTFADAIGLGVFTFIGATKAADLGLSWYAVILIGVLTGTGGGMIRDVLAGDVPFVLRKEVYASASIVGGVVFLLLYEVHAPSGVNAFATSAVVIAVRMFAVSRNMNLPKLHNLR